MAEQSIASRKLTAEEISRIQEWTKTKGTGGMGCCFCGTNNWNAYGELVEMRPFSGKGLIVGGVLIPAILLTCKKCGHLELVSALASGIVKPEEVKAPDGAVMMPEAKKTNG